MDVEAAAQAVSTAGLSVVVGYCWGGTIAWMAACHSPLFTAASCWYGGGIAKAKDDTPNIPVQMNFGMHARSEEHTSELQSLMRISYAVFCLKKKTNIYK